MKEVEDVGRNLPELSSAVAEKNQKLTAPARTRAAVKWCAQLEIELIARIVAAPKVEPEKLKEQESEMRVKLAEAIARKLIVLAELAEIEDNDDEGREITNASWGGAPMKKALEKFRNSEWRSQELERHTVVETIVVPPVRLTVEPIPWAEWHGSVVTDSFQDDSLARHVIISACPGRSGWDPW